MKYLSSEPFVMPRPAKRTCCEACVYGSGEHAEWCPDHQQTANKYITITDHYIRRDDGTVTMVRMHRGIVLEVVEDALVLWPELNPGWISVDRIESPRYLELMVHGG